MFVVYVLKNHAGRLYCGYTGRSLEQRLNEHKKSGWASRWGPWKCVYTEQFSEKAEAQARERALKTGRKNAALRAYLRAQGL